MRLWGLDGAPLRALDHEPEWFASLQIAPTDRAILVSFGADTYWTSFKLWEPPQDSPMRVMFGSFPGPYATLREVALSGDGRRIAGLVSRNKRLELLFWDRTGRPSPPPSPEQLDLDTGDAPPAQMSSSAARFNRRLFGRDRIYHRAHQPPGKTSPPGKLLAKIAVTDFSLFRVP